MFAPGSQNLIPTEILCCSSALENVTGRSFVENIRSGFSSRLTWNRALSASIVQTRCREREEGYRLHNGGWEIERNGMHWSGPAGIVSTIEDMLKWDACIDD